MKSSWFTVLYLAPLPLTSSCRGPIMALDLGLWNVAIDSLSLSVFTTTLCSILLYLPLLRICMNKNKRRLLDLSRKITYTKQNYWSRSTGWIQRRIYLKYITNVNDESTGKRLNGEPLAASLYLQPLDLIYLKNQCYEISIRVLGEPQYFVGLRARRVVVEPYWLNADLELVSHHIRVEFQVLSHDLQQAICQVLHLSRVVI